MHIPRGRRLLIPVVYGGVVLLPLLLALFARGFTRDVGDAHIAGRYAMLPLFRARSLEEMTLTWYGLSLHFSRGSTPGLQTFEQNADGTDIVLSGDVRLRLTPGSDSGGSLAIAPVAAADGAAGKALVVPFTLAAVPARPPTGAALAWRFAGQVRLLALPPRAHVDADAETISFPLDGGTWSAGLTTAGISAVAAAVRALPARGASLPTRLPDEKTMPSEAQLQTATTGFVDRAYAGWSAARLSATDSLWRMPDGSTGFSEDVGVGLLAESVARGTWQKMIPVWAIALSNQGALTPDAPLTFSTSVYVGNVREFARAFASRSIEQASRARTLLAASNNTLLGTSGLVPLLLDGGAPDLMSSLRAFLTTRNTSALDVPSSVGLLEALLDYTQDVEQGDPVVRVIQDVVFRRILPAVRAADAGVFLDTGSGASDLRTAVRCGALLIRAGAVVSDTRAAAMGRGLIASVLALADDDGFLPATLRFAGSRIASRDGMVGPEAVYSSLPSGRLLPQLVPLSRQVAAGVYLWTAARLVSVDTSTTMTRLVLGYPAGIPHHFALKGVGPFTQIRFHGIPWHTDPSYARYSDGWAYDASTRTFYGKLTGRSEQEQIDLIY